MKHTALPWKLIDVLGSSSIYAGEKQILHYLSPDQESKANAAYIVQVCNAFPDLVEALKETISSLETASRILTEENKTVLNGKVWGERSLLKGRTAITKATGEKC